MATLLAKKLGNQINKLAEQAGLEIECALQNLYEDGRRAAGCEGEVRYPKAGTRVEFSSHVTWHPIVRIRFITPPHGEPLDEIHLIDAADAAEKIISLLTPEPLTPEPLTPEPLTPEPLTPEPLTPEPLTHDNLAKSRIANLPSLEHNPLLAAYLSDASTSTATWVTGRSMLEHTILAQGFNRSHYTYHPRFNDAVYGVARVFWDSLAQSCVEDHMVCHHLLAYHDVRPSETVKGRVAYYQDDDKRAKGIRTPIKVRKYLQKFFKDFRSAEELELIAKMLDEVLQPSDEWDVRLYSDDNLDGWAAAYYHIGSCMNTRDKNYGVGEHKTYRCYCTSAMTGGAKSSGLTLAVLYQDGKPVARAITFKGSNNDKFYMRNYGDDRLVRWLGDNGYTYQNCLPNDTHLWTEVYDADKDQYLSPYVDGADHNASAEIVHIGDHHYWVTSSSGVVLQESCGYTCASLHHCSDCGERIGRGDEYYRTDMLGYIVPLCYICEDEHCYTVDDEDNIYVSISYSDDLIATNNQGYYTQAYIDTYNLVLTGDNDIIHQDYAEYCAYRGKYYSESDFTDLSGEPEFVHDTWAGYINDNNRVLTYLYQRDGTYIHDLDCRVHAAHASDVLAKLENDD